MRLTMLLAAVLTVACWNAPGCAEEAAEVDELATEFRDAKLVVLYHDNFGFRCTLYNEAEYKRLLDQDKQRPKTSSGRQLGYVPIAIKRDRLVLVYEDQPDRIRIIPLRFVSEVNRTIDREKDK